MSAAVHSDAFLLGCPLSTWDGNPKNCRWCNTPLTGRQKRWCSRACPDAISDNHSWTNAKKAARRRDRHACVNCGLIGRRHAHESPSLPILQVHHLVPIRGRHNEPGCHHHLHTLRTLCTDCHREAHRALAGHLNPETAA